MARGQLTDLAALGIEFDLPVIWQSERLDAYSAALAGLDTYECFCTRREIAEAASAPHGNGYRPYPGTCRSLTASRRAELTATRRPAIRIRAHGATSTVTDLWAGEVTGVVDDFVLVRNDGVPAYNLAVVVDDLAMGVDQVVRGDDLLSSSPRQAWLAGRLGGVAPTYAHVGLAVNPHGQRLAKRDGAVTLADLAALGVPASAVLARLVAAGTGRMRRTGDHRGLAGPLRPAADAAPPLGGRGRLAALLISRRALRPDPRSRRGRHRSNRRSRWRRLRPS